MPNKSTPETLDYQKGYRAGKRVADTAEYRRGLAEGKEIIQTKSRYDLFFCAALTGLLSGDRNYTARDMPRGPESDIAVARWFAEEAMKKARQ